MTTATKNQALFHEVDAHMEALKQKHKEISAKMKAKGADHKSKVKEIREKLPEEALHKIDEMAKEISRKICAETHKKTKKLIAKLALISHPKKKKTSRKKRKKLKTITT